MSTLNDAQLGIYGTLSIPVIYITYRHGWRGAVGWGYLFVFCTLRVAGPAIRISNEKSGKSTSTATLISNIGLSPLLLATIGILHEARRYRNPKAGGFFEWLFVIVLHLLAAQGIGMVAAGSSAFKGGHVSSTETFLIKFGICTLAITWMLCLLWALATLLPSQRKRDAPSYKDGTKLLYSVLFSLLFTGIRILYTTVTIFTRVQDLVKGPLSHRVGLSFIPELMSGLSFVTAGFMTLNTRSLAKSLGGKAPRTGEQGTEIGSDAA